MRFPYAVWLACLLAKVVRGSGLVGISIFPYEPPCAYACLRSLDTYTLTCSTPMDTHIGGMMGMSSAMTSPQCRASNTPWLTTLAWCMQINCAKFYVATSALEAFWEAQCTEDPTVDPKWDYVTSLQKITQPPTQELSADDEHLNSTALFSSTVYEAQYNALTGVYRENVLESRYGIAIVVTGLVTPLIFTWLGYVPCVSSVIEKIKPYFVYPSIIRTYQVTPLPHLLGNAPTVGQGLYIAMFVILNVVLSAVNYESKQPNAWYAKRSDEILAYVFYRTGVFAFVLSPLVLLFSSRNNLLLWVTSWSHSTFLLLHRWVARIFALYALIHTLTALPLYYPSEAKESYWIWGAVAIVAIMILVFASGLYVRRCSYEIFLVTHIMLSVFVVVGCWYHIKLWHSVSFTWGYETWLYAAIAVWSFDRLARMARIAHMGVRRAKVTELGGGYVRIDILGVRWSFEPGSHVYTFFPTLDPLRPWENHPFSVVPTALLSHYSPGSRTGSQLATPDSIDVEKEGGLTTVTETASDNRPSTGLTLFIKKSTGITKFLQAHDNLLTLLDGPYSNNSAKEVMCCDRLLLIGGGIGITSLLPWISDNRNIKLCWSLKETAACLIKEVDGALNRIAEKEVRIGKRLNVTELLADELERGWQKVGVVVSGPGGLCDDVRAAVVVAGRKGKTLFELEVDAYSW